MERGQHGEFVRKCPIAYSRHVWVIDPGFDNKGANRIDDNNGVFINAGHGLDQVIAVRPSSQVLAISNLKLYILQSQSKTPGGFL